MWTYVMATARGDRLNTMRSTKRSDDDYSTTYAYNCRPTYRQSRSVRSGSNKHNKPNANVQQFTQMSVGASASGSGSGSSSASTSASTTNYQVNTASKQAISNKWLPANCRSQNYGVSGQQPQAIGIDDGYTYSTALAIEPSDVSDDTSLYSPLMPNDNSVNRANSTADTVILLPTLTTTTANLPAESQANNQCHLTLEEVPTVFTTQPNNSKAVDYCSEVLPANCYQQAKSSSGSTSTGIFKTAFNLPLKNLPIRRQMNETIKNYQSVATIGNETETDVEELENGDEHFSIHSRRRLRQFQEDGSKPSMLRRTLNALRQRLTRRQHTHSKAPAVDWFKERFTNNVTAIPINHLNSHPSFANHSGPANRHIYHPYGGSSGRFDEIPRNAAIDSDRADFSRLNSARGGGGGGGGSGGDGGDSVVGGGGREAAGPSSEIHGSSRLCNRLSVNPSLQSHYRWLSVVSLAVLYNIIFVVGRSIFWEINKRATCMWYILDYTCDLIYVLDILVHMHEGYLDQGLLVRDAYKLRRHYFKSKGWYLDFVSIIPTDLAYIWWSPSVCGAKFLPCATIVRLNRLLRLRRMREWFDRTETATGYPNAFRICKVVLAILVLIHWNACMYFAISYALGFGTDNWVYNLNGERNSTLQRQYIYSFYWSTLTLTTIGETPTPESDAEYLFVVADFLAGVLIFATIVGNIGSMISNMNVARVEFQNRMDGVKQYMAFRKVGHELEARVIRWFAYTWSQSGALDEERVLAALPDKLKAEIAIQAHMDTLKQVRIFHDCEPGLLEALVLKLKLQVFSPGDYICRKGDVGKEMYIVKRGKLSVVADDGVTVFATLRAGSVFGEVSVLEIAGNRTGNRRTANVRSLGYSDLFCLAKRDLWETLADYPEARATLTDRGCQLLRKDGLLDEQIFADSQRVHDSIESGIEKLEVSVENLNLRLGRLLAEYASSQAKIKERLTKLEINSYKASPSSLKSSVQFGHFPPLPSKKRTKSLKNKTKKSPLTKSYNNHSRQNTI